MAFIPRYCSSAEAQHAEMDFIVHSQMAVQTARVNTGSAGADFRHDSSGSHNFRVMVTGMEPEQARLWVFQFWAGFGGANPASDVALVSQGTSGTRRQVRGGTDRKVRIYDKNGNLIAGPTASAIPSVGLDLVTVVFNQVALTTTWVSVFINGSWEIGVNTGLLLTDFFDNLADVFYGDFLGAHGADSRIYADDLTFRASDQSADALHLVRYPKLRGVGQFMRPPVANGTHTSWTGDYTGVDESPPDDDTSYVETTSKGAKETFRYGTGNPVPANMTPTHVIHKARARLLGSSKLGTDGWLLDRVTGGEVGGETWPAGSTSYATKRSIHTSSPDGDAWQRADFDLQGDNLSRLEFGMRSHSNESFDTGARVTTVYCPEIWYYDPNDLLPFAPAPVGPYTERGPLRGVLRGVGRGVS